MNKIINVYNGYIGFSDQGGGVKYVENLIKLQKKYCKKIYLLSLGKGKKRFKNVNGANVHFYPIGQSHNWILFSIKLLVFLIKNQKEFSNGTFHIHRLYFAPFIRIIKVRKIVATVHTKTFDVFRNKYPFLKFLIYIFIKIEKKIIDWFINDLSFAGYNPRNLYKKRHRDLKKKMWYLPPVFNFKTSTKSNFFKREKKKIILVVGRIAFVKRPILAAKLFMHALKKDSYIAQNFKLCFIGSGDLLDDLKKFIHESNLSKYILPIKKIKSSVMPQVYNRSHAVLFLSKSETNPFIIKEALASGKPIFTTNVGTAKNLITKKNGIMITINNPLKNLNQFIAFLKKKYNSKDIINSSLNFINNDNKILNENIKKIYK